MINADIDAMLLESIERAQARQVEAVLFLNGQQVSAGLAEIQHGQSKFYPTDGSNLENFPENGGVVLLVKDGEAEPIKNFATHGTHAHFQIAHRC